MKRNPLRVFDDVTQAIGATPLIRIDRFMRAHGIKCPVYIKYEAMNPGQSAKDRIGLNMIEEAERCGKLKPGDTIVESSSGNTATGIALVAAIRGYKVIITVPDKVSSEKINTLKALGATVIVCKTELPASDPNSFKGMARELGKQPNHFWCNQHNNEANPSAHYKITAIEFFEQMEGKIDIAFFGTGTGGTITGNTLKLKELIPNLKVVGVDPVGSVLALPESINDIIKVWKTEGIGQNCITGVIRRDIVDYWVKVDDPESFECARDLMLKEGIMAGGSSGTILAGIIKYLKENNLQDREDLRCITLLPDSAKNYMTKYMSDAWMVGHGFWSYKKLFDENALFSDKTIFNYDHFKPIDCYDNTLTIEDAINIFKAGVAAIPIRKDGKIIGVVDKKTLLYKVGVQKLDRKTSALNCMENDFFVTNIETPLSVVQKMLETKTYIILAERPHTNDVGDVYVVSENDLIGFL